MVICGIPLPEHQLCGKYLQCYNAFEVGVGNFVANDRTVELQAAVVTNP